jgi:anti-anti-sigma factor
MAEIRTIAGSSEAVSHLVLVGRLDIDGVSAVDLPLTAASVSRRRPTVIDMSGVEFLGSMGIGLLVRCAVSLQRSGLRLALFGCPPIIRKSLETTKVSAVVPVTESEAEAVALVTSA